jgi:radical SAM protein with 4Fe4S-binding SPASM domain
MSNTHYLEITTIAGCKVNCSYCPQGLFGLEHKKVSDDRMMSLELFKKCLKTVPTNIDICFAGYSEPFLNLNIMTMIRHAHEKGHSVSLYSTLVGMTIEHVQQLERLFLDKFHVHLPDDGKYMRVDIDEEFLAVVDAIKNSSILNVNWINYFGLHPKVEALVGAEWLADWKLTSRAGNVEQDYLPKVVRHEGPIWCTQGRLTKNVLLPNGEVALCCVDFGRKHIIGDLTTDAYADLHKSKSFLDIIDRMNSDANDLLCRTCEWAEPITNKMLD